MPGRLPPRQRRHRLASPAPRTDGKRTGDFVAVWDNVYDMKDVLDDADAPEDGRSLILSNAVATNLLKDDSINGNLNAGDEPLRAGALGTIAGMQIFTTNVLPANAENLTGFACVSGFGPVSGGGSQKW